MNMNLNQQPDIDKTRRDDMMRRTASIHRVHVVNHHRPRFYAPLLVRLGTLIARAGYGLQTRYAESVNDMPSWTISSTQSDSWQAESPS